MLRIAGGAGSLEGSEFWYGRARLRAGLFAFGRRWNPIAKHRIVPRGEDAMRKLAGTVLCAMMVCGAARAADSFTDARAAMAHYAQRFDNAYMAAARPAPAGAPYDASAAGDAQKAHDQAMDKCFDRQGEFATRRAWMECFLAADAAYAATVHLRDTQL